MPVNHYFQDGKGIGNQSEKRLYEDLIIEGLKIYGQDVYYLPRTLVNRDLILGEDMLSKFSSALLLEAYMETTEGFAGEQEIINKFGLEIREDTTFMISKRRFDQAVDDKATLVAEGRPNEGDILYYPLMNSFFEIQFFFHFQKWLENLLGLAFFIFFALEKLTKHCNCIKMNKKLSINTIYFSGSR